MINDLYKSRSAASCIAAATNFFTSHFKEILRKLWAPVLTTAAAMGTLHTAAISSISATLDLSVPPISLLLVMAAADILLMAGVFWLRVATATMVNNLPMRRNAKREFIMLLCSEFIMLLCMIAIIVIAIPFFAAPVLFMGKSAEDTAAPTMLANVLGYVALVAVMAILLMMALIPCIVVYMKYMLTDTPLGTAIKSGYREGFHHWGKLFLVVLLLFIIGYAVSMLFSLPLCVLTFAQVMALEGTAYGDPTDLPSYMACMSFLVTFAVAAVSLMFLHTWTWFVAAYTYGSVSCEEQERKTLDNNQPEI